MQAPLYVLLMPSPSFFDSLRLNLTVRVLGLTLSIFALSLLLGQTGYFYTATGLGLIIIVQVVSLIKKVEKSNLAFAKLLNYIQYDDFSNTYSFQGEGKSFTELGNAFNSAMEQFRNLRAEKEMQYQYLNTIVQYIGIGIISFDKNEKVQMYNNAAKRILKKPQLVFLEDLKSLSPPLLEAIREMSSGNRRLVRESLYGNVQELALHAIELNLRGEEYKLITLQNIHSELEEKEMDAWANLIRVLTHEIMNSVSPISSLAATIEGETEYLKEKFADDEPITEEDLDDMQMAAEAIRRRSESLIHFVSEFRSLAQTPKPKLAHIEVSELMDNLNSLLFHEMREAGVTLQTQLPEEKLRITADPVLIEQVLINLMKNAKQAIEEDNSEERCITLRAWLDEKGHPTIAVKDTGPGIPPDALAKIFIPFFTTKKSGSGIGLSLSRQIMRQHNGTLTAHLPEEGGTEFRLCF